MLTLLLGIFQCFVNHRWDFMLFALWEVIHTYNYNKWWNCGPNQPWAKEPHMWLPCGRTVHSGIWHKFARQDWKIAWQGGYDGTVTGKLEPQGRLKLIKISECQLPDTCWPQTDVENILCTGVGLCWGQDLTLQRHHGCATNSQPQRGLHQPKVLVTMFLLGNHLG